MRPQLVTSRWPVPTAMAALLLALSGLLAWQYAMPPDFDSTFVLNHAGVDHFRDMLGIPHLDVALRTYTRAFRGLLIAAWAAYFAMILAAGMGGPLPARRTLLAVVVGAGLVATVLWPPSFSCDVYGYVAYGRMPVLYGLNPYTTSQGVLRRLGDPTGRFLVWDISSPYGPLWTSLSVAVVWVLRAAGLFAQVVAIKLIAAAAVVVAAVVGGRVADRLAPGNGDLTLLAIGLNPLFLMEGAGNAHNDLVMMALFVVALDAAFAARTRRAVSWAAVAGAIKFLPLFAAPWFVLHDLRERPRAWRRDARALLGYALLSLVPITLAFAPYWHGAETLRGLGERWRVGQVDSGGAWGQAAFLLVVWGGATLWSLRGDRTRIRGAWMFVAATIGVFAAGIWLPWYLSWVWVPALLAWGRSAAVSYVAFCFAVVLTLRYSVPH